MFGVESDLGKLAEEIERVGLDDLRAIARDVFRPETLQVVAVGSLSEAEEAEVGRVVRAIR